MQPKIAIWAFGWRNGRMTAPWLALYKLIESLARLELNYELVCLVERGVDIDFGNAKIRTLGIGKTPRGWHTIRRENVDVLLENAFPRRLANFVFRHGLARARWVYVHGHGPWGAPSHEDAIKLGVEKRIVRAACAGYSRFFANSGFTADFLTRTGLCRDTNRLHVLYLGSDFGERYADVRQGGSKSGARPDGRFLHIANSADLNRKGTPTAIRAFAAYLENGHSGQLRIVGDRAIEQGMPQLVAELGLRERVVFLGNIPEGDLATEYAAADALLFPSVHEGFGIPIVEAQSMGCPVIGANRTAIPEVMGDGGILVDEPVRPGDIAESMALLVQDEDEARRRRNLGYRNAARFSWYNSALTFDCIIRGTFDC